MFRRASFTAFSLPLMLLGCSNSDPQHPDASRGDLGLCSAACPLCCAPDGQPACGAGVYPCGPYGTAAKGIAGNLQFIGYQDPDEQCKANTAKQLDTSKPTQVSFKSFYLGDPGKSCKRKLLWVMVSAGWCTPCKTEVPKVQADYASGKLDDRVAVLNLVFETETRGDPATLKFLGDWVSAFKLTYPVGIDPQFTMSPYFVKDQVPFNMLIDLADMRIFYQQPSGSITAVYDQINAFFNP